MPSFQENGQFIGESRYRQLLRLQQPPISPADFEGTVRNSIVVQKLRDSLTQWISVSDDAVEREFRQRNEKVKIDLVTFSPASFRHEIETTDAELDTYFGEHTEDFRVPERRKVRFLLVDAQSQREGITVSEDEIQRSYDDQFEQYSTPEQVRARHILLSTEGEDEEAVRAEAAALLTEAKLGADFAELATTHSDDEGSAARGGDLDYFGRGQMVPEFEEVAFSLEPGAISELVQTQFGFHIIMVEDKREAGTRPLDEVRDQIVEQLTQQKAQEQATSAGEAISAELAGGATLDTVTTARGLTVQQSDFFAASEPIPGLGFSPDAARQAFALADGETGTEPVTTPQGPAFVELLEKEENLSAGDRRSPRGRGGPRSSTSGRSRLHGREPPSWRPVSRRTSRRPRRPPAWRSCRPTSWSRGARRSRSSAQTRRSTTWPSRSPSAASATRWRSTAR